MVDWDLVHDDFQEWKQQRDLEEEAAKRERQRQPFKETYFPEGDLQLTFENYFGPDQEDIAFPFHHYLNDKTGAFGGVNIYPGLMGLRRDVQGNWQRRSHGEISREKAEELFENEYKPF